MSDNEIINRLVRIVVITAFLIGASSPFLVITAMVIAAVKLS